MEQAYANLFHQQYPGYPCFGVFQYGIVQSGIILCERIPFVSVLGILTDDLFYLAEAKPGLELKGGFVTEHVVNRSQLAYKCRAVGMAHIVTTDFNPLKKVTGRKESGRQEHIKRVAC